MVSTIKAAWRGGVITRQINVGKAFVRTIDSCVLGPGGQHRTAYGISLGLGGTSVPRKGLASGTARVARFPVNESFSHEGKGTDSWR